MDLNTALVKSNHVILNLFRLFLKMLDHIDAELTFGKQPQGITRYISSWLNRPTL